VPYVFGSAGKGRNHQTDRYQATDCADVLIGAARRAGARRLKYTSVSGLFRLTRKRTPKLLLNKRGLFYADGPRKGQPATLRFGSDVRRGDLMLIDYVGFTESPRSWDHVAVVTDDRGTKGRFDPRDPVLHMGYAWGLVKKPAHSESPSIVQFLRWRKWIQRAIGRQQQRLKRARLRRLAARRRVR
jgi:hypothetical protein